MEDEQSGLTLEAFLREAIASYDSITKEQNSISQSEAAAIKQIETEIDLLKEKAREHQNTISLARIKINEEDNIFLQKYQTQKQTYFSTISAVFGDIEELQTSFKAFEANKETIRETLKKVSGAFGAVEQQNNMNKEALEDLLNKHQLREQAVVFDFNPCTRESYGLSLTFPNPISKIKMIKQLQNAVDEAYTIISEKYHFSKSVENQISTITFSYSSPLTAPITIQQANYIRAELVKIIEEKMHPEIKESGIKFTFTASLYDKLTGVDTETTAEFKNDSANPIKSEVELEANITTSSNQYTAPLDVRVEETVQEELAEQKDLQTRRLEYIRKIYFKKFKDDGRPVTSDLKKMIKYQIDYLMDIISSNTHYYNNQVLCARTNLSGVLRDSSKQLWGNWSYSLGASVEFINQYAQKQALNYQKEDPITTALALEKVIKKDSITESSSVPLEEMVTETVAVTVDYIHTIPKGYYVVVPTSSDLKINAEEWGKAVKLGKAQVKNRNRYIDPNFFEKITETVLEENEFELHEMYPLQKKAEVLVSPLFVVNQSPLVGVMRDSSSVSLEVKVDESIAEKSERSELQNRENLALQNFSKEKDMQTRRLEYIRSNYFNNFDETVTEILISDIKNILKSLDTDMGIERGNESYYYQNQISNQRNNKYGRILKFKRKEGIFYYKIDSVVAFIDNYIEKQLLNNQILKDPVAEALKKEYSVAIPSSIAEKVELTITEDRTNEVNFFKERRLSYVEKLFFSDISAETITEKQLIELLKNVDRECFFQEDENSVYTRMIEDDAIIEKSILGNKNNNFTKQESIAFIDNHIKTDGEQFNNYKDIVKHQLAKEDAEKREETINYFTGLDEILDIDLLFVMRAVDRDLSDNKLSSVRTKKQYIEELEKLVNLRLTTKPDKANSYQPMKDNENPAVYQIEGALDIINTYYKARRILKDNSSQDNALGKSALMTELAKVLKIEARDARDIARKDEADFKFDEGALGSVSSPISSACMYSTVKVLQYAAYRADKLS